MGSGADSMNANDHQVGGDHYQGDIQHWDIVVQENWDYFTSQVTKYMWRWRKKNGLEDLKKARHFLEKLIEEVDAGRMPGKEGRRMIGHDYSIPDKSRARLASDI